jgi:uncharacterized cupredoxin-like copper-binding protein
LGSEPERRRAARRAQSVAVAVAAAGIALVVGAGCFSGSASGPPRPVVELSMRDFSVRLSRATVPAGPVAFDVSNAGPSTHEFKLVRTDVVASELPLDASGLAVDDESRALHRVGGIDTVALGGRHHLEIDLRPGRYVVYCNLEGHYLAGTYAQLDVVGS